MSDRLNIRTLREWFDERAGAVTYDQTVTVKAGDLFALVEAVEAAHAYRSHGLGEFRYVDALHRALARFDFGDDPWGPRA